jgi:hypothetical protein
MNELAVRNTQISLNIDIPNIFGVNFYMPMFSSLCFLGGPWFNMGGGKGKN